MDSVHCPHCDNIIRYPDGIPLENDTCNHCGKEFCPSCNVM